MPWSQPAVHLLCTYLRVRRCVLVSQFLRFARPSYDLSQAPAPSSQTYPPPPPALILHARIVEVNSKPSCRCLVTAVRCLTFLNSRQIVGGQFNASMRRFHSGRWSLWETGQPMKQNRRIIQLHEKKKYTNMKMLFIARNWIGAKQTRKGLTSYDNNYSSFCQNIRLMCRKLFKESTQFRF